MPLEFQRSHALKLSGRLCRRFALVGLFLGTMFAASATRVVQADDVDFIIENGLIYDGSGATPVQGHVAVKDGNIVSVGSGAAPSSLWRIDAAGLVIAPGFIDLHTHGDSGVVSPLARGCVNYLTQGCTTLITGNCGMGPADVGAYYKQMEIGGIGANVGHLIPQGTLRLEVVGKENRPPTKGELAKMRSIVQQGMQDGAWGMSTGLIYTPSTYASTSELIELAKVVASHKGIYASHIRGEESGLLDSVNEALRIGREAEIPIHISHLKVKGTPQWGMLKLAIALVEQARSNGMTVTADQYPYTAASTSLEATIFPAWSRSGGLLQLIKRLDDPASADKIREEVQKSLSEKEDGKQIVIATFSARPDWVGKNLKQIAELEKISSLELAESIMRQGGASIVNFAMSEEDVRSAMACDWVATASDGSVHLPGANRPHPRSYGTFPRKIGYYSIREQVLPLEQAIRSSSGLPADILGLTDRGYLRIGQAADIVIFSPKELIDQATFEKPFQYSSGIHYVFVNGTPAIYDRVPTGAQAGKVLRKPVSVPAPAVSDAINN
ncbi:N-acyl-D-amino-acid deacylase family protein [Planctomicrobium sp. SH527]|uniref:N-acyl-D-amino-acid deacylase family protein n=1 Tax=Planctomicrobium sp. SH527 TaxID=3448123 RepID=UPI003F5AE744